MKIQRWGKRREVWRWVGLAIAGLLAVTSVPGTTVGDEENRGSRFSVVTGLAFSEAAPGLTLDLYLPTMIEGAVPCVITIQGGGFRSQDGQRFKPFAEHLASNGLASALISYRGTPEHRYTTTLADVKESVRYIRRVSERYRIDPARVGATGRSAGGTLAALLAVTGRSDDPAARIQAAVCFAGVYDFIGRFTAEEQRKIQPNRLTKIKTNGEWIGSPFSPGDRDWQAASAITHVDAMDPPILFLHSRNDTTVPWPQSRDMHAAMRQVGIASELRIYETGGHAVRPEGENSLDAMVAFFHEQF